MSNLLATFVSSAGALDAYDRVLEVSQNNVTNASTPGYVRQRMQLYALPFDPSGGTTGGVRAGQLESARNDYAERAVRLQTLGLGRDQQNVNSLTSLESLFDVSGNSGIPKALNQLYQAFSAWGNNPTNEATRQTVIARSVDAAHAFQQTAKSFDTVTSDTNQQLRSTVGEINRLVGEIKGYNSEVMKGTGGDAGMDARTHAALEELSQYIDFTATEQNDHTVTVLLNGQVPLLIEDQLHPIAVELYTPQDPAPYNVDAPPLARVKADNGTDVTAQTDSGQLGALLDVRNRILPSYIGDAYQAGSLNRMAKQFADRVNQILGQGVVSEGPPPVSGSPLFHYDTSNDTNIASSMTLDPGATADGLAPIDQGPPAVSNGIPLALSALSSPVAAADKIDGVSFTEFFGQMASQAGSILEDARNGLQVQQSLVAQAKDLRQQLSGVSLDEEATLLIQFQRGFQAVSRFITTLDQLTQDVINMIQ